MSDTKNFNQYAKSTLESLKERGVVINFVGNRSYGKPTVSESLIAQVRITDPEHNQRVCVCLDVHQQDNADTLGFKIDLATKLLEKAKEINDFKQKEEEFAKQIAEQKRQTQENARELKKSSPILYDFLQANLGEEEEEELENTALTATFRPKQD